jgi:hypothetical protein
VTIDTPGAEGALDDPHAGHLVQLYGSDPLPLARNVGRYLAEGLERGEAAVIIAARAHRDAFAAELEARGADSAAATRDDRLVVLDADETLARFMVDGQPDWDRFEASVGTVVRALAAAHPAGVRAYGEMVGVLWQAGRFAAAIRLEGFWNVLLGASDIRLFCAYPIDVCGDDFTVADVDALLCAHTHVLPSGATVEASLERAMADVLGTPAEGLRVLIEAHRPPAWAALPRAEATILWLRQNLPQHTAAILARAREFARLAA